MQLLKAAQRAADLVLHFVTCLSFLATAFKSLASMAIPQARLPRPYARCILGLTAVADLTHLVAWPRSTA